tara:strand:+ start:441 stop:1637 length:1197 start_codon:yes stop_codon:yes gene_type:complete
MANTLNLGNGDWATKEDLLLGYNNENAAYKPLPFDFTRASSGTVVNRQGLIETVQSGIPRIDFLGNTKGALLLEPQRTNLIPYSEDFSNAAWAKQSAGVASAPIVTSNYAISPDGTLNADRVIFDINGGTTSSDFSQIADGVITSIGDVTNSLWIKSNTASNYNMSFVDPSANFTSIIVTNQWQRFDVTSTTVSTSSALRLRLRGSESTSDSADVSIWGAQVEQGSYPTSYIPTQGSTVTRVQEVCNNGGNDQVINSIEGVLYAEIAALSDDGTTRVLSISDGGNATNVVRIGYSITSNQINVRLIVNSVTTQFNYVGNVLNKNKIALKWKLNDAALWVNGVEVDANLSFTTFIANALNILNFSNGNGTSNPFYGNTKDVRVYNTALTDAELQALTTI